MNETYTPTLVQDAVSGHYRQDLYWSVKGKPSRAIWIQILSIPLAMLFGFAFIRIAIDIGNLPLTGNGGSFSFGFPEVGIGSVGIFATIIMHELAHGFAMRWYGIRPQYGALWKRLIFYTTAPGYGFRRNAYIVVALAPLVGLSCLAIMGMYLLQGTGWVALLTLCAIINASGAIGDLWMVSIILRYPKTVFVVDEKDGFRVLTRVTS